MGSLFILLFTIIIAPLYAQKYQTMVLSESAGLDFNSGSPVTLTNGKLTTNEGCATISDTKGNYFFYTMVPTFQQKTIK
jgi:hypothetical protein